jgi:hypothetical protein
MTQSLLSRWTFSGRVRAQARPALKTKQAGHGNVRNTLEVPRCGSRTMFRFSHTTTSAPGHISNVTLKHQHGSNDRFALNPSLIFSYLVAGSNHKIGNRIWKNTKIGDREAAASLSASLASLVGRRSFICQSISYRLLEGRPPADSCFALMLSFRVE